VQNSLAVQGRLTPDCILPQTAQNMQRRPLKEFRQNISLVPFVFQAWRIYFLSNNNLWIPPFIFTANDKRFFWHLV
jgi:hypothetical protein